MNNENLYVTTGCIILFTMGVIIYCKGYSDGKKKGRKIGFQEGRNYEIQLMIEEKGSI